MYKAHTFLFIASVFAGTALLFIGANYDKNKHCENGTNIEEVKIGIDKYLIIQYFNRVENLRSYNFVDEITDELVLNIELLTGVVSVHKMSRYEMFITKGACYSWGEIEESILDTIKKHYPVIYLE